MTSLRDYQQDAVDAVYSAWKDGMTRPALVLPTGTGKTRTFSEILTQCAADGGRALAIAHRGELLDQIASTCRKVAPTIPVGRVQAGRNETRRPITVASMQSLSEARTSKLLPRGEHYDVIVVDECHHAASPSYVRLLTQLGSFDGVPTLGVTATMSRGDRRGLGDVWEDVVYEKDTMWAIGQGWLVEPRGRVVVSEHLDLNKAKVSRGDYQDGELGELVSQDVVHIVDAWVEHADNRITVAFCPTIASSQLMAEEFRRRGIPTGEVYGSTSRAERGDAEKGTGIYGRLARGELRVLCTVMVCSEGWDCPQVSCILMARPTRVPGLYCFDDATEVLTPAGWRYGATLAAGDSISAFDPETGQVRWEPVQTFVRRPLYVDEYMVELSSPTVDLRVTNTHRMVYRPRKGKGWRIRTAGELMSLRNSWVLPVAGVEEFPGVALTDDEIALVGWVQTDGHVNRANEALTISQQDPDNCAEIERILTACGLKWRVQIETGPTNYGERKSPLHVYRASRGLPRGTDKHLRGWGYLAEWVPKADPLAWERLAQLDSRQWRVLLDAMHRANGAKQLGQYWTRRGYHICTPDQLMADWLQAGCMRRGWRANVVRDGAGRAKPLWTLHCRELSERHVGGSAQVDREHLELSRRVPDEMVWCVSVASGALLTRRNGKGSIMGNTQIVGRGLRPSPEKTDALILDVVGASRTQSLVSLIDLHKTAKVNTDELDALPCDDCGQLTDECECPPAEAGTRDPDGGRRRLVGPAEYEDLDMFSGSQCRWLWTRQGVRFLPAGDRAFLLWPDFPDLVNGQPASDDRTTWSVASIVSAPWKSTQEQWLADDDGHTLGEARALAEEAALALDPKVAARDAAWRRAKRSPSDKMLKLARSYRIPNPERFTAGALSDEISIVFASTRLEQGGYR